MECVGLNVQRTEPLTSVVNEELADGFEEVSSWDEDDNR